MLTHYESHWVCQYTFTNLSKALGSPLIDAIAVRYIEIPESPAFGHCMHCKQCICNVCSRDTWVPWLIFDSSWLLSDAISISFYISLYISLYQSLSPSTLENSTRYCVPAPSKSKHTRYWPCVDQLDNSTSEHCGLLGFKDSQQHQQQNRTRATRAAHFAASMLKSHTAAPQAAGVKAGCETLRTWKAAETVPCRCLPSTKAWNGNIMMAYCQPSCSWTALVLLGLGTGSAETQKGRYNPHTQYSCKLHDTFFRSMSIEEPWRT